MAQYPFHRIEPYWQKYWEDRQTFSVTENPDIPKEKRRYILDMFPYPSGSGLHVGHPEGYTATDIYARYLRMNGFHVLHPIGFDSFGLPAENYAIQTKTHPQQTTEKNIRRFREQLRSLGLSYDWKREIITSDPEYYRWTQWIFLQLFQRGLAYESDAPINWCTSCKTGLANEEVNNGRCERCDGPIIRKQIRQWNLRITAYAERLLAGLDRIDWPKSIKTMQTNWIGRSEGAKIRFQAGRHEIEVYTTRPDTLFGATYLVLAPEHPLTRELCSPEQWETVEAYLLQSAQKSDIERTDLAKEKTGVFLGTYAVHPVTGAELPIWTADYILASYGTGSIMAVPAHDQRDWEFARKFGLPVKAVIAGGSIDQQAFTGEGPHICSDFLDGLNQADATAKMIKFLEKQSSGERSVQYRLRDWLFSRQRYWGEPIPIIHCPDCKTVPMPEDQLPLELPPVENYSPGENGESPLAAVTDWVSCTCPRCGGPARRETNTMPQWAGSCWYYLRYLSPGSAEHFVEPEAEKYWMPVQLYVGGAEHAVLHLLYARFWHKVLYDLGLVSCEEPFEVLVNQGMILGEMEFTAYQDQAGRWVSAEQLVQADPPTDRTGQLLKACKIDESQTVKKDHGFVLADEPEIRIRAQAEKMSKSRGNVVNPDTIIENYGADTLRVYEMFLGPLRMVKPWSTGGLTGIHRFLNRLWQIGEKPAVESADQALPGGKAEPLRRLLHQTVKKVTSDTQNLDFNTAISQMMVLSNALAPLDSCPLEIWRPFILLLSPYAPHLAEELWKKTGKPSSLAYEPWPQWDEALCAESEHEIVFQVNGKLRSKAVLPIQAGKAELLEAAKRDPKIQHHLDGKKIRKEIVVPGRLVNFVTE